MERPTQPPVSPPPIGDRCFDAFYFQHCCGKPYSRNDEWLAFFGGIADRIVAEIRPLRVLDAGCALGLLVEALRDRGVDAWGVDISSYAIEHVYDPIKPYCRHGSVVEELGGRYDLIVAIELVEHMPPREAERAVENFCARTDDVLFSSSPVDYREPTHVNVRPPEYWAEQFAGHGFYRDVDFDASFITPWAARFRKSREPLHRVVRQYERRFWEMLLERNQMRGYSMEVQERLAAVEAERDRLAAGVGDLKLAESQRDELAVKLGQALRTVANMERSWFWRLRMVWVRLNRLVGRSR